MTSDDAPIRKLRDEWEARARSPFRDFYVASHRGWSVKATWDRVAAADARSVFHRTSADAEGCIGRIPYAALDVLEIGCGVGRLAPHLAPHVRSYTGIDLAPSMIAAASAAAPPGARFFVSDGVSLPAEALDRRYGMIFALAVFIHCPTDVCAALARAAARALAPGGGFRAQWLGRADDSEPIRTPVGFADEPLPTDSPLEVFSGHVEPAAAELIHGTSYKGREFRAEELRALLRDAGFASIEVLRFDPVHLYAFAAL
jgi:SAM-dependent methyltransferase